MFYWANADWWWGKLHAPSSQSAIQNYSINFWQNFNKDHNLMKKVYKNQSKVLRSPAEMESRTQSWRPRPRTALPKTDPFEAKDRKARGQGSRTQAQVLSKKKTFFQASSKKGSSKNFLLVLEYVKGAFMFKPMPMIKQCRSLVLIWFGSGVWPRKQ